MKRFLLVAVAVGVLLVPAGAAWARGDGWEPVVFPPEIDAACGSTTVHVTFPINKEFVRLIPQPDGTTIQQFTGTLYVTLATDAGASVTVNASGPSRSIIYPNGDYEVVSQGLYNAGLTEEQAAELGTPQIFSSFGLIDFVIHPDGSATPVTIPHNLIDICAELGV